MQILEASVLGLRSAALRLRHRHTPLQFLVIPMLHMANAGFYREVTRLLRDADVVVVEGVRGRSAIGTALTATYRVLRLRRIELVPDNVPYRALGKPLVAPDVTAVEFKREWRNMSLWIRAALWPLLLGFTAVRMVTPRSRLLRQVIDQELNDLPSDLDEALAEHPLGQAMIVERDRRLVEALGELHEQRSEERITVAVAYGAAHVPVIVEYLTSRGYFVRSATWLPVIRP
ncbi:MAG TPA: hypothetical protein VFR11_06200 [Micromonosporaceae bacterium]|nr:hypothetical protein [Micromonosporaceae bacterium]